MIVDELSFSFWSRIVVSVSVELDSGFRGPRDNQLACFLENRSQLLPECLVAKISVLR